MGKKEYLFFDLDGTLIDSKPGITRSAQYALAKMGVQVDDLDTLRSFIGPPLKECFRELYGFEGDTGDLAVYYYREYFSQKGIYQNQLYPGIPRLLQALEDAGKKLVLATSKPLVYARQILDRLELTPHFRFLSGSELSGERSGKAEVIGYALESLYIEDPRRCLMVGDRRHDVEGATRMGMECVGILYGYGGMEELAAAGAAHFAESVPALQQLLESV